MTAIFTGPGTGLARGSASVLGNNGLLGSASTGRGGDNVAVNAATGNLVISRQDEFLTGRGPDLGISRTYNSLAEVSDRDNGDKWQMSTVRRVFGLTGTLNTAGSTVTYTIQCPYCEKRFKRTKLDLKLNPHKDSNGHRCNARHGYLV